MRQHACGCPFVVRDVEVEVVEAGEIHAGIPAARVAVLDPQVELILRRMCLLASVEIAFIEFIADVTRLEPRGAQIQQ